MLGDRLPTVFGVEFDMKAFSISRALAVVSLATLPVAVFAQTATTDPFTAAMTEATAKVGTYALALVGLAAVGVVFMIALKYVKKIPKAA
jgi:hypothetical protein